MSNNSSFKPHLDGSTSNASRLITSAAVMQPYAQRRNRNFVLVWLDDDLNQADPEFEKAIQMLSRLVKSIDIFVNPNECIDFITNIKTQRVSMIVSDLLIEQLVSQVELLPQLESVYIFSSNQSSSQQWTGTIPKIKGIHTSFKSICESFEMDQKVYDQNMISFSFYDTDPSFLYCQLIKEIVLAIEQDNYEKLIKELTDFCRKQGDINIDEIELVQHQYRTHSPIWWLTVDTFMHSMISRGLSQMDIDIIIKMQFFIRDIHKHIKSLYERQKKSSSLKTQGQFKVYFGQSLTRTLLEDMAQSIDGLICCNGFVCTSLHSDVALKNFAIPAARQGDDMVGVLFEITIDPSLCEQLQIPFANISKVGAHNGDTAEILLTTHTIFRIRNIQRLHDSSGRLWQVQLTLSGTDDPELHHAMTLLRQSYTIGWDGVADILINMSELRKAERLYQVLLKRGPIEKEQSVYLHQLGWVYSQIGKDSKAVKYYQKSLKIRNQLNPPDYIGLASSCNNMGVVYQNMGDYPKALQSHEKALEIKKMALPSNHPDFITTYQNIGAVYYSMGEYTKALQLHNKALEIERLVLPRHHHNLADSCVNVALLYEKLNDYKKALTNFREALKIWLKSLPPSHPNVVDVISDIERVEKLV